MIETFFEVVHPYPFPQRIVAVPARTFVVLGFLQQGFVAEFLRVMCDSAMGAEGAKTAQSSGAQSSLPSFLSEKQPDHQRRRALSTTGCIAGAACRRRGRPRDLLLPFAFRLADCAIRDDATFMAK